MCSNGAILLVVSPIIFAKNIVSLQWNKIFLLNFTVLFESVNKPQVDSFKNIQLNPLSANLTKWSNTLKQYCLSVFDHFVILAVKGLIIFSTIFI